MKTFKEIFDKENMEMPTSNGIKRVQSFNSDESVSFILDDESREFLKEELSHIDVIYEPTLKKFAENILILNRQKHRVSDRTRLSLMNEPVYQGYRNNSFYTSVSES